MKTGIVYYKDSMNLGDDIQTYAISRLVKNPIFLERESLHETNNKVNAVISGWFMTNPENFPPSPSVNPLFISFHGKSGVIKKENYAYFKKYEPIGCRDYTTLKLFKSIGIKAYYSSCATLTLPKLDVERGNEVIVVDLLRANYSRKYREFVKRHLIPKEWRKKVNYYSHFINEIPDKSIPERMQLVQDTLKRYAKAKLVITSLIHCALPCVAMGVPVLFVDFGFDKSNLSRDRFEGITDLFQIYNVKNAPFAKRDKLSTLLRVSGLYRLVKNKIEPIPDIYFQNMDASEVDLSKITQGITKQILDFEFKNS